MIDAVQVSAANRGSDTGVDVINHRHLYRAGLRRSGVISNDLSVGFPRRVIRRSSPSTKSVDELEYRSGLGRNLRKAKLRIHRELPIGSLAAMELGHGRIYRVIGRRLHGSDPLPDQETFEGCVYKGRTEWSTEGQPMDAFWSPDVGHFLFFRPGTFEAEERSR